MAKAKFDIKTVQTEATKPLYAGVGVTDLAVELVRGYVTEAQARFADVQKSVASFDYQPQALRDQAKARRADIEKRVADLQAQLQAEAKALPAKVQKLVDENVESATDTYADLVKRGETLVTRIRKQQSTQQTKSAAKTTVAKAKTTKTQATKAASAQKTAAKKAVKAPASKTAAKKTSTARSSAKSTATAAKKTATTAVKATEQAAAKVGD